MSMDVLNSVGYVVGFMFSKDKSQVLLINKKRPAWQEGKLNGIGGRIEDRETPLAAMIREFKEETGLNYPHWLPKLEILFSDEHDISDLVLTVFFCYSDDLFSAISQTEEAVNVYPVEDILNLPIIPNLSWIIPFLLDDFSMGVFTNFSVKGNGNYKLNAR